MSNLAVVYRDEASVGWAETAFRELSIWAWMPHEATQPNWKRPCHVPLVATWSKLPLRSWARSTFICSFAGGPYEFRQKNLLGCGTSAERMVPKSYLFQNELRNEKFEKRPERSRIVYALFSCLLPALFHSSRQQFQTQFHFFRWSQDKAIPWKSAQENF